jgi:signal transduction histidine kinase
MRSADASSVLAEYAPPASKGVQVLIAEDDLPTRLILQRAVQRLGFECIACDDGESAWTQFRAEQPDVVISDWRMPGLEGPEFCRRIRSAKSYTYFIMATALDDPQHVLEGMRAGVDDYLRKPVTTDELQARLIVAQRVVAVQRGLAASIARRDALLAMARRFSAEHGLEHLMREVLVDAVDLLGGEGGEVRRWREETQELVEAAVYSTRGDQTLPQAVQAASAQTARLRLPVLIRDAGPVGANSTPRLDANVSTVAAAPLLHEGHLLGTLAIFSGDPAHGFDSEDADLLELVAGLASAALVTGEAFDHQQRAVQELRRLHRAKADFVSIISHEFRTPLTGIQGFSEMMRDEDLTSGQMREFAGDINKDAHRLNRLIGEMLDLDRMESGQMTLHPEVIFLNELVNEVVGMARPNARRHSIELQLDPRSIPLLADRDKIVQVLTNLINNAIKYSPAGGAVVVGSHFEDDVAHVTVRDQGIGIAPEALETIFERYTRAESPQSRGIPGTGLGLPIVREIARLHGGRAWAESQPGGGSTFHVTIPCNGTPPEEEGDA